jgi:hypothetical protein
MRPRRWVVATSLVAVAVWLAAPTIVGADFSPPEKQVPVVDGSKFAGLKWTFVRIKYGTYESEGSSRLAYWDEPWAIDAPAAEQNLSRRLKSVTAIDVGDPIVLTLEDEKLWEYPWIYIVEPSNLVLKDSEVPILREFLLRGGTLTFDDFHGPYEWELTQRQLQRVFPDREIVEIAPPHPIYTCFYRVDRYPQIPGLGSFLSGRTWEKGGFTAHLRGILDDAGRPMVLINWNTDMGDGVEWSNAQEYPGYIKWTAQAYQMLINEVIYSLTH